MKVLIASDCYIPTINGVVTSIMNLKKGLEMLGHEVRLLTLSSSGKSEIIGNDYYLKSMKLDIIYPDVGIKITPCRKIMKEIYDWKPDVVHSQHEFSTFSVAKKISKTLNIPFVQTYHTVYEDYTHLFSPSKKIGKKVVKWFICKRFRKCDAVIAPTEKVEKMLAGYGVKSPIGVVPSGIDLVKFQNKIDEIEILKLKEELNIPIDYKIFVSVSRISKEKNIEELVECFAKCEIPKAVLIIVGDGPSLNEMKDLVIMRNAEKKIFFTGMVAPEKIPLYYQMADVFVSASTSETQGLTYIESLASGIPILCRKDDCLTNILNEGINGWAYETKNGFMDQLMWCSDNFRNSEKNDYYQETKKSVNKYSIESFAKSVEKIYLNLIEDSGKCS